MTKNLRLKQAREAKGWTQKQLAEKINSEQPYIAALENDKGYGAKTAKKLADVLGVTKDWLLTGYENRLGQFENQQVETKIVPLRKDSGVPFYDIDVTATVVTSFSDVREEPEYYVDYKPFNDCDAYLPVFGSSMFPLFASGEVIAVKQIYNLEAILWGEPYLIMTTAHTNGIRAIKLLFPHDEDDTKIILRSSNPQFKGDTVIDKSSIVSIYKIRGKIQRLEM